MKPDYDARANASKMDQEESKTKKSTGNAKSPKTSVTALRRRMVAACAAISDCLHRWPDYQACQRSPSSGWDFMTQTIPATGSPTGSRGLGIVSRSFGLDCRLHASQACSVGVRPSWTTGRKTMPSRFRPRRGWRRRSSKRKGRISTTASRSPRLLEVTARWSVPRRRIASRGS